MERKRIEKLVALLLVGILMPVSLFPFRIYADTIDTHIRGRNYTYEPITYSEIQLTQNTYYQNIGVFHITFELDDEYIGYVLPNYSIQYDNYFYGAQTPSWGTLSITFDRRVFVNGSSFSFDIPVNWYSISINTAPGGDPFNYDSYTITSSDVIKYADIDSLDQIINILTDLYNSNDQVEGLLNDQLTQLQLIVSNTSLANTYLEQLTEIRQYNIPFETFTFAIYLLSQHYEISEYSDIIYYRFPRFIIPSGSVMYASGGSTSGVQSSFDLIFITNKSIRSTSDLNTNMSINDGVLSYIKGINSVVIGSTVNYLIHVRANNFSSSGRKSITVNSNTHIVPICAFYTENQNFSTEFALQFGLSNDLLDNIQIIANGTQQSQSASGSLDQTTSQFSDDANDLVIIEESFNNSMNQSLQSVNPTFNMGSSFLASANWVSQQFNRIVNNTPFASLITFGLTLGLGLLIIGKVRK